MSFLLLTATTGMAVSKHFCEEYLISTSLFSEPETCCHDVNCCHNETAFYQVDEEFASPGFSQIPVVSDIDLFIDKLGYSLTLNAEDESATFLIIRDLPPPPKIPKVLSMKQTWLL